MRENRNFVTKLAAWIWLTLAGATVLAQPLGRLPQFDDLDLAPDGQHLLLIRLAEDTYNLQVRNIDTGDTRTLFEGGVETGLINWCRWANNERIVCSVRHYHPTPRIGHLARTRLFAINVDGGQMTSLIPRARNFERRPLVYEAQVQDRVLSWLFDDPQHILIQLNRDMPNRPSVYKLNIYTNNLQRIKRPRGLVRRWFADPDGNIPLALGYKDDDEPIIYRVDGRRLTPFASPAYASDLPPQPMGYASDQRSAYMSMTNGADRHGIYRVSLTTGEVLEPLHQDPQFDVFGSIISHPETGDAVGVSYLRHHPALVIFNAPLQQLFDYMASQLPGRHMRLVSSDFGYDRFVLYSYGAIAPRYYLFDRASRSMSLIGADYEELRDAQVVDLVPVNYKSRDGIEIPAYLADPPGPGPHPTVLLPHGGPYARDSAEFDAWTQFLAGQGFAVFKPNYRGSVGYGEAYMQAGYRQWGLKMQDDLMDGLDWLVDNGIADPQRVCVVGASYGGYTALVSAYKFTHKIKCSVSLAGISDLERMVSRLYNFDLVERNRGRIQPSAELAANSPIRNADAISVPVLLLHGDQDTVVRVRQSRRFAAALQKHGKPHRYVEQTGGDHFLSWSSQRAEFLQEMGQFLQQHIGSDAR